MALTYREYHTQQDYENAVVELIPRVEGFSPNVYRLDDGMATIGCGYTFNRNNNVGLWTDAGINLTQTEWQLLEQIDNAPANRKTRIALTFGRAITVDEAGDLLRATYPQYEGPANNLNMPLSRERVAFVAVTYNVTVHRGC